MLTVMLISTRPQRKERAVGQKMLGGAGLGFGIRGKQMSRRQEEGHSRGYVNKGVDRVETDLSIPVGIVFYQPFTCNLSFDRPRDPLAGT